MKVQNTIRLSASQIEEIIRRHFAGIHIEVKEVGFVLDRGPLFSDPREPSGPSLTGVDISYWAELPGRG